MDGREKVLEVSVCQKSTSKVRKSEGKMGKRSSYDTTLRHESRGQFHQPSGAKAQMRE
jgi:hypothetical protein